MPKAQTSTLGVGAAIARLWWVVLLATLVGGAVAFAAADRSTTERIYGVVNMRPVATLANDRVDLVEDLDAALTLPSVLTGPAEEADMSVADLRQDLSVQPVGQTSFVRVGVIVHNDDAEAAEVLLRSVVASAAVFLSGDDSVTTDEPLATQARFIEQRESALDYALETTARDAPAYDALAAELENLESFQRVVQERLVEQEDARAERQVVLPLTIEGRDLTRGGSDTQVRRAAAGAAVGGLVAMLVIAGVAASSRRRPS